MQSSIRLIPLLIVIFSILVMPMASAAPMHSRTVSEASPVLFGKAASNGILIGFFYSPPLGNIIIVHRDTSVPVDQLQYAVYNPGPGTSINLTIEQYSLAAQNLTIKSGNQTLTRVIFVQSNVQWDNQSILSPSKTIVQGNISLPLASSPLDVQISYAGAVFQFRHQTAPAALPLILTQGGELEIWLSAFLLGSFIWVLGAVTARKIIDRVKWWPKRSFSGWILILMAFGIGIGFFGATYYYDLGYIPWYSWLIPLYYLSSSFMLGIFRPEISRWELMKIYGERKDEKVLTDVRAIYVSPDAEHGHIKIDLHSRKEAIARLFGRKIPVEFEPGVAPWYAENEYWEDPVYDTRRTYFLHPLTEQGRIGYSYLEGSKPSVLRFIPKLPDTRRTSTKTYRIPLSGHYSKRIAEFLGQLFSAAKIGKQLEDAQWKIEELNGRIQTRHSEFNRAQLAARAASSHGLTEESTGARTTYEARDPGSGGDHNGSGPEPKD
ncbi:MAG: hypothetical protein M1476_01270 [Candidatus Thermoplasmatota archaeon]|nr:hypothetical protein [Candidatus Thermoplasmatota archaeon]